MPRRKAKKVVKRSEEEKKDDEIENEIQIEEKKDDSVEEELERQIAAMRAIRDVEVEQTVTALKLIRSYFDEEKQKTPVLEFFKENVPGLSLSKNEETGEVELKWNDKDGDSLMGNADGIDLNYSILKRLSMGSLGGYDLPDTVKASFLGTDNLENLVFQGTSESQMRGSHDALQTPGVTGQRLSYGMTPKSRRPPKHGEIMMSVHGSPLGVYKEDNNMGAINEENS